MINWYQCVHGDRVRILDADDNTVEGIVECVTDSEEQSDLMPQEVSIGIITDSGEHLECFESDIKDVTLLSESKLRTKPLSTSA